MTRTRFISLLASAIGLFCASTAFADCKVWTGPPDECFGGTYNGQSCDLINCASGGGVCHPTVGVWQYAPNWLQGSAPASGECVTIDTGKRVAVANCVRTSGGVVGATCGSCDGGCESCPQGCELISSPNAACAALTISSGTDVYLDPARSMTLAGDATIDTGGELGLYLGSTLKISADVTIRGTGTLEGHVALYGFGTGRIENAGSPVNTLTIDSGVTVRGRLVVDVALTNKGTINADWLNQSTGKGIVLQRAPITGTGTFHAGQALANFPPGVLSIEAPVTAGGTWILDTAGTSIVFDAASTEMTGDFEISTGTLKVNQNLTTTGDLDMTGGTVKVAINKNASFSK